MYQSFRNLTLIVSMALKCIFVALRPRRLSKELRNLTIPPNHVMTGPFQVPKLSTHHTLLPPTLLLRHPFEFQTLSAGRVSFLLAIAPTISLAGSKAPGGHPLRIHIVYGSVFDSVQYHLPDQLKVLGGIIGGKQK